MWLYGIEVTTGGLLNERSTQAIVSKLARFGALRAVLSQNGNTGRIGLDLRWGVVHNFESVTARVEPS
jgi:hypothetical protein